MYSLSRALYIRTTVRVRKIKTVPNTEETNCPTHRSITSQHHINDLLPSELFEAVLPVVVCGPEHPHLWRSDRTQSDSGDSVLAHYRLWCDVTTSCVTDQ